MPKHRARVHIHEMFGDEREQGRLVATVHLGPPWTCDLASHDGQAGYGTGTTMAEAVEDALTDLEQARRNDTTRRTR